MVCRRLLLLSLALLLIITTTTTHGHTQAAAVAQVQGMMMRSMAVGSRPPSCAGRCWWCGDRRCEAVQVPVTPHANGNGGYGRRPTRRGGGGGGGASSSAAAALKQQSQSLSYDDHSNYKPLSWRCKCGGLLKP